MNMTMSRFSTPKVVQNLIIINVLVFMAQMFLPNGWGNTIVEKFGLFFWESPNFQPYQFVTYMFLHANLTHIFFNMFALWMFGRGLEYDLGSKRFLTYYMITGIGAGLIQMGVNWIELEILRNSADVASAGVQMAIASKINVVSIGASGAVFGILLAFGLMHPNAMIMLLIPPIPMKAKYFVIFYGLLTLFFGLSGIQGGVAHFAHLGGMLWGFLLLNHWKRKGKIHY